MTAKITYTQRPDMIGVWVNKKPAGRIRIKDGKFLAYTNKREPGKANLGTFNTQAAAGTAVADFYLAN